MLKKFLVLAALVLLPTVALAGPITSLVVFGDSLSDQGNAFLVTGGTFPPAPYAQRASNGPVAVEVLAGRLGAPLTPVAAGGTNYAFVGAATGPVTFTGTSTTTDNFAAVAYGQPALANTGMTNQVLAYLGAGPVVQPDSTLFVVWGGPNDFFIDASPATAGNAVTNLANDIGLLYAAGARRFLVPNMPDLSLTPFGLSLSPAQQAGLQALSIGFNVGLDTAINGLSLLPNIEITPFDTFGLLHSISANPAAFGFTTASAPCAIGSLGGTFSVCADPDHYLFWDSVHPTAAGHQILGDAFADALGVPEPATVLLFALGLAGAVRRRRHC
jgi:phospholipase/lecithinase/hemolysin